LSKAPETSTEKKKSNGTSRNGKKSKKKPGGKKRGYVAKKKTKNELKRGRPPASKICESTFLKVMKAKKFANSQKDPLLSSRKTKKNRGAAEEQGNLRAF